MKIVDLLEREYAETEWTDTKLPEAILQELTADLKKPKLPRLSRTEMYALLEAHSHSLMPLANVLQHWVVSEDARLQRQLRRAHKDVNVVELPSKDADDDDDTQSQSQSTNDADDADATPMHSDADLMQLMRSEHLGDCDADALYATAMLFYDLSDPSPATRISANNRLSSILLILAAARGHIEAQC